MCVLVAFVRRYYDFVKRNDPEGPLTRKDFEKEGCVGIDKKIKTEEEERKRKKETTNRQAWEERKTESTKRNRQTKERKKDKRTDAQVKRDRETATRIFQQSR